MNKKDFFNHINKHTKSGGIIWIEDFLNNTKIYTAYSKQQELLIFNNKYSLSFDPNTKDFFRVDFEDKNNKTKLTDIKDLNCKEGLELIKELNIKTKRKMNVVK